MAHSRSACALAFLLLPFAGAVQAEPIYPVSARLTLAPREQQRCLTLDRGEDCGVVDAVRGAFAATVARMFKTSASPDLQIVLTVKRAEMSRVAGLLAEVVVQVRVLSSAGDLIDEMEVYGDGTMLEPSALPHAEEEAASIAAARFERAYAGSIKIGDYLVAHKVAPASAVEVHERGDKNFWITAGGGFVFGGGDSDTSLAPTLRAAASYRWFFAQALFSRYSSTFQGVQTTSNGSGIFSGTRDGSQLTTTDLGLEAGVVVRVTRGIDLRLGPGVHYLTGDGGLSDPTNSGATTPTESYSIASLTAFASLSTSFIAFHRGPRVLLGAEARGYFFSSPDLPTLGRQVPAASSSVGLFVGLEWTSSAGGDR